MARRVTQLTDTLIKNTKPQARPITLFDGGGLYLQIMPTGSRLWRLKYRLLGKEKLISLGSYPEISLADARKQREEARSKVAKGIDPVFIRRQKKESEKRETDTFEKMAREWHAEFSVNRTFGYSIKMLSSLEQNIFPWLGAMPIESIRSPDLLNVLQKIKDRGALETAHRLRSVASQIFRYAITKGKIERDPARDLIGAMPQPKEKHYAAITDPRKVGALLRAIDGYQGSQVVKCSLKLAPMLFVRPGELRHMEWKEIDFDQALWTTPGEKTKTRTDHIVPLCRQALEILEEIKPLTHNSRYVFPSERTFLRPMSENAHLAALRRMGYEKAEMTPHGFRAMARTILDEILHVRPDIIEHQLGHAVRDPLGRAYNRTQHIDERRKMMQQWADYLDALKAGAVVLPFKIMNE